MRCLFLQRRRHVTSRSPLRRRRRRLRVEDAGRTSGYQTETSFGQVVSCLLLFAPDPDSISYPFQLGPERHRAPELLFTPELVGLEYAGVHQVVVDSINRADLDLRKSLFGNVVLSGGGTLVKGMFRAGVVESCGLAELVVFPRSGFGDRLLHEVKKLALRETKIRISAPPERKYSTWIGGSILAGLSTFKKMWVSAEEYQEGESSPGHPRLETRGS
jgi:actin-related protein